jgi:hypothetical protein
MGCNGFIFNNQLNALIIKSYCYKILPLLGSGHQICMKLTVPNVQQKTPDDGQRRCPTHVEFYNRINLNN